MENSTAKTIYAPAVHYWIRTSAVPTALMALTLFGCAGGEASERSSPSGLVADGGVALPEKAAAPRACTGSNYDPYTTTGSLCGGIGGLQPGSSSSCQEQICWAQSLTPQESKIPATHFYESGCECVKPIERKFPHITAVNDPGVVADLCGKSAIFIGDEQMVVSTPFGRHNCLGLIEALEVGAFPPTMTRRIIEAARPVCCADPGQPPNSGEGDAPETTDDTEMCVNGLLENAHFQGKPCETWDAEVSREQINRDPDLAALYVACCQGNTTRDKDERSIAGGRFGHRRTRR